MLQRGDYVRVILPADLGGSKFARVIGQKKGRPKKSAFTGRIIYHNIWVVRSYDGEEYEVNRARIKFIKRPKVVKSIMAESDNESIEEKIIRARKLLEQLEA